MPNPEIARAVPRQWSRVLPVAIVTVCLIATGVAVYLWSRGGAIMLASEHGPLELLQDVVCFAAGLVFLAGYREGRGAVRVAAAALGMLCAAAFVRELDVRSFGGPEWYRWLASHGLQEILFVGMLLPIPIYLLTKLRYFWALLRLTLRLGAWPIYFAGVLLATSVYLDERVVVGPEMRFWEELIETYGYGFLFLSAVRHRQLAGHPDLDPVIPPSSRAAA